MDKKTFCVNFLSMFEEAPFKPFEHTMTFFRKMFLIFFNIYKKKKHMIPIQDFFHKNMHAIKKKEIFDRKVFKMQRFSKVLPNAGV